jgi:hypothetical protein
MAYRKKGEVLVEGYLRAVFRVEAIRSSGGSSRQRMMADGHRE